MTKKFYAVSFKKTNTCCGTSYNVGDGVIKRLYENEEDAIKKCQSLVKRVKRDFIKTYKFEEDEIICENSVNNDWFLVKSPDVEFEYKVNCLSWKTK